MAQLDVGRALRCVVAGWTLTAQSHQRVAQSNCLGRVRSVSVGTKLRGQITGPSQASTSDEDLHHRSALVSAHALDRLLKRCKLSTQGNRQTQQIGLVEFNRLHQVADRDIGAKLDHAPAIHFKELGYHLDTYVVMVACYGRGKQGLAV